MMGLTGALFQDFFGNGFGAVLVILVMIGWMTIPILFAIRRFKNKDL